MKLLAKIDGEAIVPAASRAGSASIVLPFELDVAPGDLILDTDGARLVFQISEAAGGRGHALGRIGDGEVNSCRHAFSSSFLFVALMLRP
jgi:hypothetical protein